MYRLAAWSANARSTAISDRPALEGSNNWVIGASRSATGRPMLANDPHRAISLPSLRYLAHLSAPGLDVIGAGEPALPGISIGHNGQLGFGLTIFSIDQEDLYVYRTNPQDPLEYRYRDGWEPMRAGQRDRSRWPAADPVSVRAAVHPARPGDPPRPGQGHRVRGPGGLAGTGHGALPRQPGRHACAHRSRVRRGDAARGARRGRTRFMPPRTVKSAGRRSAAHRSGRTGTAPCRCPAMAATSGPATTT